jgi:putative membrane protein
MSSVAEDRPAGATRLHPLTPLLRGAKVLAAVIAAVSWQGYAQLGPLGWAVLVGIVLIVGVAISAVSWAVTGYRVIGRELRISEGLLWRRTRAIPLERLQAVDVVRPVLARLTGLAELRLEVIGGRRTEAPLAYLSLDEAVRLREDLLHLAGIAHARHSPAPAPPSSLPAPARAEASADSTERFIHAVSNRDVLVGQLLTPHTWLLPVALVATLFPYADRPSFGFIAVASMLTALVSVVQVPVRKVLGEWNFRIAADPSGLRLRHGLLDTRSQTVPPHRLQAIGLFWPFLWRLRSWLNVRIDVAGYGHEAQAGMRAGVLLPVADLPTARRVVAEVLDVDVAALTLYPPPPRARWLTPLAWPNVGIGLTDTVAVSRDGWLRLRQVVVPLERVQSVRILQGPLQRLLRLATVHLDTAGGLNVIGRFRDADEAYRLSEAVRSGLRLARSRAAAYQRSPSPTAANVTTTYAQPTNTSIR